MPSPSSTNPAAEPSPAAYVEQAAALLGLPLAEAHRPGVVANVARLAAVAAPLLEFPLPASLDAVPVFVP